MPFFYHGGHLLKDLGSFAPVLSVGGIEWLLLDKFDTARAAGSVNGTLSEPSGHTRTVTDTGNTLSITGGQLVVTAVAGARDPWLRYATGWARVAGRMLRYDAQAQNYSDYVRVGWASTLSSPASLFGTGHKETGTLARPTNAKVFDTDVDLTTWQIILRSTGYFMLRNGVLAWIYRSDNTATLYPMFLLLSADAALTFTLDNIGIADLPTDDPTLFPIPVLSDTFPAASILDYGGNSQNIAPTNLSLDGTQATSTGSATASIQAALTAISHDPRDCTIITRVTENTGWDSVSRSVFRLSTAAGYIMIRKVTNALYWYVSMGTSKNRAKTGLATADYMTLGFTVSSSADEAIAYYDGAAEGAALTGFGNTFAGYTGATLYQEGGLPWIGSFKDCIFAKGIATPAQMATLHTAIAAGTLTGATLDGIFGANNYIWYKHDETYDSDGLGHIEADGNGGDLTWVSDGNFYNNANKAYIDPTLGAEIWTNGDFTDWTGDDPDGLGSIAGEDATAQITERDPGQLYADTKTVGGAANFWTDTVNEPEITDFSLTVGNFYKIGLEVTAYSAGSIQLYMNYSGIYTAVGTYAFTSRANFTYTKIRPKTAGSDLTVDNATLKPIALKDAMRAVDAGAGEPYVAVDMTVDSAGQAGVFINLDSYTNPQNFIHVYFDQRAPNRISAYEVIAGTPSADSISAVAAAYSAGARLVVRRIGNEVRVFYNNAYIGSWTTAASSANTLVALFATTNASYFQNLTVFPTNGYNYGAYVP